MIYKRKMVYETDKERNKNKEQCENTNNKNRFELQIISKGSIIDHDIHFVIETIVFRMNSIAYCEWLSSKPGSTLKYHKGKDYEGYLRECVEKQQIVNKQIVDIIGIDISNKSIEIVQILNDIFAITYVAEMKSIDTNTYTCSICGNKAHTDTDVCEHISNFLKNSLQMK